MSGLSCHLAQSCFKFVQTTLMNDCFKNPSMCLLAKCGYLQTASPSSVHGVQASVLNHLGLFAKSSKTHCHPLFEIKAMNLLHSDNLSRVRQSMKYEEVISVLSADHSHPSTLPNDLSKHELNNYCYQSCIHRAINPDD